MLHQVAITILTAVQAFTISVSVNPKPAPIPIADQATSSDNPNSCRGLWHIVWSCLSTIFLCTWVAVHPNIPGPQEPWSKVASRRLGIMLAVLIAPELIISWAMRQRILARRLAKNHKRHGWTNVHGFFAVMGGFMAHDGDRAIQVLLPNELGDYSLSGKGNFPRITETEIKDKSKGNFVSKGLVVLQVGWFMLQCLARKVLGLPIAELELVTIAFAVISFAMLLLWWNKPLDVRRAVRVYKKYTSADEPTGDDHMAESEDLNLEPTLGFLARFWARFCSLARSLIPNQIAQHLLAATRVSVWQLMFMPIGLLMPIATGEPSHIVEEENRISTFYPESWSLEAEKAIVLSGTLAAVVFGAIHCAAWKFIFPSDAEKILWRFASVAITGLPLIFPLLVWLHTQRPTTILLTILAVQLPVYVLSRLILLVLPFLSLRALPPRTLHCLYWISLVPHL